MSIDANDASHWREFEKNQITHSAAHYLMAIDQLHKEYGYARVTNIAEVLEISRGAASMSLAQLKKRGWVTEDANRFLLLTDAGKQISQLVENNFVILADFFQNILGVGKETALADACKMEHLMSLETGRRLVGLMDHILSDQKRSAQVIKAVQDFSKKHVNTVPLHTVPSTKKISPKAPKAKKSPKK